MKLTITDTKGNEEAVTEVIGPVYEAGSKRAHYKLRLGEGSDFELKKRKKYQLDKRMTESEFDTKEEIKILDAWEEKDHRWAKYEVHKIL